VNHFHAHWAAYGNGFSLDETDGVRRGFIGARRGEGNCAETKNCHGESKRPRDSNRMEERSHYAILPVTWAESLIYTIRVLPRCRTMSRLFCSRR
jgi:hypothetical protein